MATAARPIWSGSISFGLVNIPVRLYIAVREHRIAFNLLHDQDKVRLKRKLVCPADGKEVHPEHIVRGYEVAKDQYVVVHQEEIEACAPAGSKTIEITDFVDLDGIDPIYFDRPYYVAPNSGAGKSYRLLLEAMKKSKKVGVAKIIMHEKEYLAALRPVQDVIVLSTMHFGDEVVPAEQVDTPREARINDREMKIAQQLIDSLATNFDPGRYHDQYRDCLQDMLEKKAAGEQIVTQPVPEKKQARATDLMTALQASLAQAKGKSTRGKRKSA
ncbi:MAG: Ku protein [Tepidisphaeraceae bacterium]